MHGYMDQMSSYAHELIELFMVLNRTEQFSELPDGIMMFMNGLLLYNKSNEQ